MKKILFTLSLIAGLFSVPSSLQADDGEKKTIRFFLSDGEPRHKKRFTEYLKC